MIHEQIISLLLSKYVEYFIWRMEFEIFVGEKTLLLCLPSKCYYFKPSIYWYYDVWSIPFNGRAYKKVIIIFKTGCSYFLFMELFLFLLFSSRVSLWEGVNSNNLPAFTKPGSTKPGNLVWVCMEFLTIQDKLGYIFKEKFLFPLILCRKVGGVSECVFMITKE